jgi:hypothetical protein
MTGSLRPGSILADLDGTRDALQHPSSIAISNRWNASAG